MKKDHQQSTGYIIGGSLVLLLFPFGIYKAAMQFDPIYGIELLHDEQLKIVLAIVMSLFGFAFGIWSIVIQNIVGKGGPLQIGKIEISPKTSEACCNRTL